jgi:hypothetical protein
VGFVGRRVLVDRRGGVFLIAPGSEGARQIPGLRDAVTTSGGRVVATQHGQLGVFDLPDGNALLRIPHSDMRIYPLALSPNGEYLVAAHANRKRIYLFIANVDTGQVVTTATLGPQSLGGPGMSVVDSEPPMWEDSNHVLIVIDGRDIVRIGLHGRVERAAGPAHDRYGYVLPAPQ